jgi:AICAR transformylase/IMP cyclohydrolase PurH
MRYILDVSGRDLELIKASIVNFERSLELSSQGDFEHLIEELNDTYLSLKRQKRKQLNSKLRREWGVNL